MKMASTTLVPVASILPYPSPADATVTLTFQPGSPVGLTAVNVATEPTAHDALLDVLFEALQRLRCYIDDYEAAWADDTASDC